MDRDEWIPARVFRLRQSFADIYVSIVDDFETRGSIHISQLSEDFVDSVEDVVQEGQEVQVKFLRVSERSQFDFTLLDSPRSSRPQRTPQSERHSSSPPDRRERSPPPRRQPARVESFAELDDMWFTGTVSGVQSFGAFVDIKHPVSGDQATGLVHVSQLADDYVESASDVVSVGEQHSRIPPCVDVRKRRGCMRSKKVDYQIVMLWVVQLFKVVCNIYCGVVRKFNTAVRMGEGQPLRGR
eukprot:3662645-Amphidinium_carterae.1